jgi:uncharacterized protein
VQWVQTGGPAVQLENANGNTATFIAPAVPGATPLTFEFIANGGAQRATTPVTVNPAVLGFAAVPKNLDDIVTVPVAIPSP